MGEFSSPEVPQQRKKTLLPASALPDSSSPAPARKFKIKRIVSPAVRRKSKTKRSAFVKSKLFDHQCREAGKSDGSASNSSDDGDKSDISCVSPGQDHPNAEKFEYLQGMGSQSNMPPPLQATRFIEEDRSPLADRIEKRILAQKAERRALREAELVKVRLAASARKATLPQAAVADVPAPPDTTLPDASVAGIPAPPVKNLPKAAVADVPAPPVTSLPEAAVADVPAPPLSAVHEVVHVSSKSPLRHPFFGSLTKRPGGLSGFQGVSSNSVITFSAVRVVEAVLPQGRSPSMTSSMQPEHTRHPRLKLKASLDPSKHHPSAAACPPSHLAFPPPKPKEAPTVTEPKTPSKTPSKLILDDEMNSPSRSVKSSAAKSSPLSRLNLDSSPVQYNSKRIICLSQELALLAVDDSPVSRSEAFRALMAANPGFYGFSTGTQIDRVQQHSRETQTSPMRTSGLTVEDLRDELGKANRALLMAFGF